MQRPWSKRAEEIEAESPNTYSNFAAFREWFSAQETKSVIDCDPVIDDLDGAQATQLYCIFCDVFDGLPEQSQEQANHG